MDNFGDFISKQIQESIITKEKILGSVELIESIEQVAVIMIAAYKKGNKLLICGNGGSAADAQHIAAELVSKFRLERPGLPAIALTTNTSVITAIANDYEYNKIFERQVEAFGIKGDILIGISTSGNSSSITKAFNKAQEMQITTIGLLGHNGGQNKQSCDFSIIVPCEDTPRIQESHIMIGHIICDIIEKELFRVFLDE